MKRFRVVCDCHCHFISVGDVLIGLGVAIAIASGMRLARPVRGDTSYD